MRCRHGCFSSFARLGGIEVVVDHLGMAMAKPSMVATLGLRLALILLHKSKRVGHGAGFTGVQRHPSTTRGDQAAAPRRALPCRHHVGEKPAGVRELRKE